MVVAEYTTFASFPPLDDYIDHRKVADNSHFFPIGRYFPTTSRFVHPSLNSVTNDLSIQARYAYTSRIGA